MVEMSNNVKTVKIKIKSQKFTKMVKNGKKKIKIKIKIRTVKNG